VRTHFRGGPSSSSNPPHRRQKRECPYLYCLYTSNQVPVGAGGSTPIVVACLYARSTTCRDCSLDFCRSTSSALFSSISRREVARSARTPCTSSTGRVLARRSVTICESNCSTSQSNIGDSSILRNSRAIPGHLRNRSRDTCLVSHPLSKIPKDHIPPGNRTCYNRQSRLEELAHRPARCRY